MYMLIKKKNESRQEINVTVAKQIFMGKFRSDVEKILPKKFVKFFTDLS